MVAVRSSIAALMVIPLSLSGCGTQQIARFEAKVGAARCTKDRGLAEGTIEHQQCVAAYRAAAADERADTQAALLDTLGATAQVWSAKQQAQAQARLFSLGSQAYGLRQTWWDAGRQLCRYEDGSVLNVGTGSCPANVVASR
jgi:hypothetical protein